jgi:hypothetical protein
MLHSLVAAAAAVVAEPTESKSNIEVQFVKRYNIKSRQGEPGTNSGDSEEWNLEGSPSKGSQRE